MDLLEQREYYSARADASRTMALRATDPHIAQVHNDFAHRYDEAATERSVLPLRMAMGQTHFSWLRHEAVSLRRASRVPFVSSEVAKRTSQVKKS